MNDFEFANEKCSGLPSIFIAQPNLGEISTNNVARLLRWFGCERYNLEWFAPPGVIPHDRARNLCHREFIENSDADYIFWLDANTIPPARALDRLLYHDRDVVACCVQTQKSQDDGSIRLVPLGFRKSFTSEGYAAVVSTGLTQVHIASCAATLIKREVMEGVGPRAFSWGDVSDEWGVEGLSEDFYFCERVIEAGYEIWMDYDLLCRHWQRSDMLIINQMLHRASR